MTVSWTLTEALADGGAPGARGLLEGLVQRLLERRAALSKNQEAIRQQMQELERRKHQQTADYKQSLGDL